MSFDAQPNALCRATAEARRLTTAERTRMDAIARELDQLTTDIESLTRERDVQRFTAQRGENLAGDLPETLADADNDGDTRLTSLPPLPRRTVAAIDRLFQDVPRVDAATRRQSFAGVLVGALGGQPLHPAILAAANTEGIGSEGGFAVAAEVARELFVRAFEGSVLARIGVRVEPMLGLTKQVIGLDDDDETDDAEAGIKGEWAAEASERNVQLLRLRGCELTAKKMIVLAAVSGELAEDNTDFLPALEAAISRAMSKKLDRECLTLGTGAGRPLAILNSEATVVVSKEAGQLANTLVFENVAEMWSRLAPGSHEVSWWLASPSTLPQLLGLTIKVKNVAGTENVGGSQAGIFHAGGPTGWLLMGRPVLITSRVKPLGTKGDLILLDPTQYALGLRRQLAIERSPHVFFNSDRIAVRARWRGDGQPLWDKPRTLVEGPDTVSPFVVLETRA
jgi:HK97 family phage major capsid protein